MTDSLSEKRRDVPPYPCPLCLRAEGKAWHRDRRREYRRCPNCALVYVPAHQHLGLREERERYAQHRNHPDDPAYRRFLARLFEPLAARLPAGAEGLDYGCGPGPTLSLMFGEAGHPMAVYDPCFSPGRGVLRRQYDFVTCSEVVEHFARPAAEWRRLAGLLKPGAWLGVMTQLLEDGASFADWYYKNDPTHVCFYARRSIEWIAAELRLRPLFHSPSVVLLEATGGFAPPHGAV